LVGMYVNSKYFSDDQSKRLFAYVPVTCVKWTVVNLRFEVFTAVRMMLFFFWVLEPCRLVGICRRFREICLHLQGWSGDARKWWDLYRSGRREVLGSGPLPRPSLPPNLPFSPLSSIATSALKMETVSFSETLASTDESTGRQNPEEKQHHSSSCFQVRWYSTVPMLSSNQVTSFVMQHRVIAGHSGRAV
jgi:hypothetical protein